MLHGKPHPAEHVSLQGPLIGDLLRKDGEASLQILFSQLWMRQTGAGNSGEVSSAESRRFRSGDRLDKQDKLTDNEVDIWGIFKFNWVYEFRYVYIYIHMYINYIIYDIVQ